MQYTTVGNVKLSRLGLGTKRLPMTDVTRVDHVDVEAAGLIVDTAAELGMNLIDTSYSHGKGETESILGTYLQEHPDQDLHISTGYLELIDPNHEQVFAKQLKKLQTDHVDFYSIEGVCNMTRMRDVDSGATDFFFAQKEAGAIGNVGFASELSAENLAKHLELFPWDFVILKVNYFDWFMKGGSECYAAAKEAGVPVFAHAPLHIGNRPTLKPEALQVLSKANPQRSQIDWALRFVKSLDNVACVTCNVNSMKQVKENAAVFEDDEVLTDDELETLRAAAEAQQTVKKH